MKNKCSRCGGEPKFKYDKLTTADGRIFNVVFLECGSCGMVGAASNSDPQALLYWNRENPK